MIVKAYGDGSSIRGISSMAMFLGTSDAWDGVGQPWREATRDIGCFPFRMTNFVATEKDRSRRIQALCRLFDVIDKGKLVGSVAVINDAVYALLPRIVTLRLGSKYLALASVAFSQMAKWRIDHMGAEESLLTCVFEQGKEEGQDEFRRITRIIADNSELLRSFGIQDIVFEPKGAAGLQMADMLAWLMTHWVPELHVDDDDGFSSEAAALLVRALPIVRRYETREFLLEIARTNTNENMREIRARFGLEQFFPDQLG